MRDLILKTLRESVKAYPELKGYLSDEALRLIKQLEDEPEGWRDKFKPNSGQYEYKPGKVQIDEKDIDEAIKRWNKVMPDLKGLLDAQVEIGE